MKVVITGGSGFLGRKLAERLLDIGEAIDSQGRKRRIETLHLCDVAPPLTPWGDSRVAVTTGHFGDEAILNEIVTPDAGLVFHLAAIVSGGAEEDFDLGMKVNLTASMALLERLRALGTCPRLVFASSVATYGGDLPEVIDDRMAVTPQTSYGAQKAIVELLLSDYSRRGFLDGRALRLPTIIVRPGKPNKALSSFASSLIREPLEGRDYACPVPTETSVWVLSPRAVVEAFLHAAALPSESWGSFRAVALPGLTVSVQEMVEALRKIAGESVARRIRWESDSTVLDVVKSWPTRFAPKRALGMGFRPDASLAEIIQVFIADELGGRFAT